MPQVPSTQLHIFPGRIKAENLLLKKGPLRMYFNEKRIEPIQAIGRFPRQKKLKASQL